MLAVDGEDMFRSNYIQLSVSQAKHLVVCSYAIINNSVRKQMVFTPEPPYVAVYGDQILVASALQGVPEGYEVEVIEQPSVRELEPKKTIRGTARLSLPIAEALAYSTFDPNTKPVVRWAKGLRFSVGAVPGDKQYEPLKAYDRGRMVDSLCIDASQQMIASSAPCAVRLPVRLRPPGFNPFAGQGNESPLDIAVNVSQVVSLETSLRNVSEHDVLVAADDRFLQARQEGDVLFVFVGFESSEPRGQAMTDIYMKACKLASGQQLQQTFDLRVERILGFPTWKSDDDDASRSAAQYSKVVLGMDVIRETTDGLRIEEVDKSAVEFTANARSLKERVFICNAAMDAAALKAKVSGK